MDNEYTNIDINDILLDSDDLATENIGAMIPQIGLDGKAYDEDDDIEESVDVLVEERSIRDIAINCDTKLDVSRNVRVLIGDICEKEKEIEEYKEKDDIDEKKMLKLREELNNLKLNLKKIMASASIPLKREMNRVYKTTKKELKKDLNQIEESVELTDETDVYTEVTDPVSALAIATLIGSAAISNIRAITAVVDNAMLNRIERYIVCHDKHFVPLHKLSHKVQTISYNSVTGEQTPKGKESNKKAMDIIKSFIGSSVHSYYYNGKLFFQYTFIKDTNSLGVDTKNVYFQMKNPLAKKYELYYKMKIFTKHGITTPEIKNYINEMDKKSLAYFKKGKALKESLDDVQVSDTIFEESVNKFQSQLKELTDKRDLYIDRLSKESSVIMKDQIKEKISFYESKMDEILNLDVMIEAANMEEEIKPIVQKLEDKGYMVKYASPGHTRLRKKEDQEPDGVYHNKLYTDARIMFDKKYQMPEAPKHWFWKEVDNCSYLDVTPCNYDETDGTPDEAFSKWKENYMNTLRTYVDKLNPMKDDKGTLKEEFTEDYITFMDSLMM